MWNLFQRRFRSHSAALPLICAVLFGGAPRPAEAISLSADFAEEIRQAYAEVLEAKLAVQNLWMWTETQALNNGATTDQARAAATAATFAARLNFAAKVQRLLSIAPWTARGGYMSIAFVEVGLWAILIAEVVVLVYVTYLLVDQTIDYFQAVAASWKLDEEVAKVQGRINAIRMPDNQPGCCCIVDRSALPGPSAWANQFMAEFDCKNSGSGRTPLHCYDGRPSPAEVLASGNISAACSAKHTAPPPPPVQVAFNQVGIRCSGYPTVHSLSAIAGTVESGLEDVEEFCAFVTGDVTSEPEVVRLEGGSGGEY